MLKLRRAFVVEVHGAQRSTGEQALRVQLADAPKRTREAIADAALVGVCAVGDEVIVNVQALDLGLGSGGFDIVHVNLTRGLQADGARGAHVMKLNYTSLQHAIAPVEGPEPTLPLERPVAVLALHGQLASVAWAFAQRAAGRRLGYVQTEGGALPASRSRTVAQLRDRGLLAGHITAGAAFGGEHEAITTTGALAHGLGALGWDAAICGPGPGIVGSSSSLGHGGMAALDSSHAALALGAPTVLVARMSSGDRRARHRGVSHHTLTVLDLLLAPVVVALPAGVHSPVGADRSKIGQPAILVAALPGAGGSARGQEGLSLAVDVERPARITRHEWRPAAVDLPGFGASGLPACTMGRTLTQDPLFFAAALAGGGALAEQLGA